MTRPADDARTLRARHSGLADALDRAAADRPEGVARFAGRVYSGGAIPTAVPRVFLTRPLAIDVAESEGATPTLTPDTTASVPVLVIGPGVPAAGDDLVARLVGGRWVAMRPGVAGPPPPCGTITVTVKRCRPALPLVGTTYRVYDGATNTSAVLCTGTTDAAGQFSCGYSTTRSYLVEVDPPTARYKKGTLTVAATCPTNYSQTLNMPASDDHICLVGVCDDPVSRTIYVTDPVAGLTIPCVYGANGYSSYFGCRQVTVSNARTASCVSPASRSVALGYELVPPSAPGNPWTMRLTMSACVSGGAQPMELTCAAANPSIMFINSAFGSGSGACPAPSGTIAINFINANAPLPTLYGTGTVNFPFSE